MKEKQRSRFDRFIILALILLLVFTLIGNVGRFFVGPIIEQVVIDVTDEMSREVEAEVIKELESDLNEMGREFEDVGNELGQEFESLGEEFDELGAELGEVGEEIGAEIGEEIESEIRQELEVGR